MKIKIKSSDNFNQNYEKSFELEKVINLGEIKEYHYKDDHGNCKVIDNGDFIEIYRHGEINSKQVFKNNKNTPFIYITKQFRGKYEIFTPLLRNDFLLRYSIKSHYRKEGLRWVSAWKALRRT